MSAPSAHPAAASPAVLTTTTSWTTETLDSCLRTMHLPKSRHHHQAVLQWIQKALEKDESTTNKPSISTQYAMALVLLRVGRTGWKGVIVDDLVEVYFRLALARQNDWSVVSVVRWCLHVLTIAREQWPPVEEEKDDDDDEDEDGEEEDTAEDEEGDAAAATAAAASDNNDKDSSSKKDNSDNMSSKSKFTFQPDVSIVEEQLKEVLLKADQATNSFFSFWTVWDKVCPALLSPPVGNTTKTMIPIVDRLVFPVAATEDKTRDQNGDDNQEQDVNYDILCLSWKLTCLAETILEDRSKRTGNKSHPLLAPTAGFVLLIALAFWNRKEGTGSDKKEDEDDDDDDDEETPKERNVFAIPHKKDEKPEVTVKEPPAKRARQFATVEQDSFLKWLIETRLPSTRTIPQLPRQPDSPKLTVTQVLDVVKTMIQKLCKEVMGASFLSVSPAPGPVEGSKGKWPAWVKPLSDFTGYPADMPKRMFENFDKILSSQCNRSIVVKEKCVCDITRLMQTYLNTGKNSAAAMKNSSDLQAVPLLRPPQVPSGTLGNPFFQAFMAPGAAMSAAPPPVAQPVVTMQVQPPAASTSAAAAAAAPNASPEPPTVQPAARPFPVNYRKSGDPSSGVGPGAVAPHRPYPPPQAMYNPPARKIAETKKATGRKQTLETTPQKKVELSLNPHDLAAAMELAVAETKKLEDAPSFLSTTRSVTPPAITEAMELTEWTVSLFCLESVRPSRKLREYLEAASKSGGGSSGGAQHWHDVMFPILNRTLLRLAQEGLHEKPPRAAFVTVASEPVAGAVQIHGNLTPDKQLGKAVVALYYHALEAVLYVESTRLKVTSHPQIVLYPIFHRALLACCTWCVTKAVGVTQKLRASPSLQAIQIHSTLQVCESNPYDFLKVSDSFLRSLTLETARGKLGSPLIFALPRTLQKDLKKVETNVADSLLWAHGVKMQGSLPSQIDEFREKTEKGNVTLWPTEVLAPTLPEELEDKRREDKEYSFPAPDHEDYAEYRCVNFVIRKIIKLAFFRIEALCRFLDVPPSIPLATHAWVAFRFLVRNRPDVLFDRHIDHWILCCLYGVSKSLKYAPELTFSRIIEAYVVVRGPEVGDVTCQRIVRHIKIYEDSNDPNNTDNIIVLYNRRFVPVMKEHLLGSKSLKRVADEIPKLLADMREETATS